jgi:hypothetical protein
MTKCPFFNNFICVYACDRAVLARHFSTFSFDDYLDFFETSVNWLLEVP